MHAAADYNNIGKFLNRILGMAVQQQNALFQYFSDTLAAVIQEAKKNGRFDMGILGKMVLILFRPPSFFHTELKPQRAAFVCSVKLFKVLPSDSQLSDALSSLKGFKLSLIGSLKLVDSEKTSLSLSRIRSGLR